MKLTVPATLGSHLPAAVQCHPGFAEQCPPPLFETESHIAQTGLELPSLPHKAEDVLEPLMLLPPPPDARMAGQPYCTHLYVVPGIESGALCVLGKC